MSPDASRHCFACLTVQCRDHALSEHKTLKDILSDIDAMTVASPGFNDKLKMLMVVSGAGPSSGSGPVGHITHEHKRYMRLAA